MAVEPDAEGAAELVVLGAPVPGLEISVVDPADRSGVLRAGGRRAAHHRQLAHRRATTSSPTRPPELIIDGWLHTGDLAYTVDGQLIVCGRIKDVIIVGGRNVYPQDIEKVAGEVDGVRPGNVIAFGTEGRHGAQNIIVVAEARSDDLEHLAREVTRAVNDSVGIPPKEVVLVEPGTVPEDLLGQAPALGLPPAVRLGELARLS